jgi:hypothetical protein
MVYIFRSFYTYRLYISDRITLQTFLGIGRTTRMGLAIHVQTTGLVRLLRLLFLFMILVFTCSTIQNNEVNIV